MNVIHTSEGQKSSVYKGDSSAALTETLPMNGMMKPNVA